MKVLIIGLGSIAKKHISALEYMYPKVELYALRSSLKATKYQNVKNIFSLNEVSDLIFNFCIISSPTYKHSDDIFKLIKLKIPLFIEKPLFDTLKNKELIKLVNNTNIKTYIACNLRFLDCLIYVKNEVLSKNYFINEVNAYCGSYLPDWRPNDDFKKTYSANTNLGGGVHLDLIHEIDYCYWFFGKPKNVTKTLRSKSNLKINSTDYANYLLEYNTFEASIVLNYYRRDSKRQLEILFEKFTIVIDLLNNTVYKNNEIIFQSKQKTIDTYQAQLKYFIDTINLNNFNSINEAFEVLKICLE